MHRGVAVANELADAPFVDAVLLRGKGPLSGGVDHVGETPEQEMSYITVLRALVGPLAMRETSSYVMVPAARACSSASMPWPMIVTGVPTGRFRSSSTANASIEIVPTTRLRSPATRTSVPVRSRRK